MLKQVGVDVRGEPKLGGTKQKALIASHKSASLGELLAALGKDSDNFCAEMLFKAIGAKAHGRPASADAAAEAVRGAIERFGAFEPGVVVKNGSGLFDADRTTPAATTALLRTMSRGSSHAPEFLAQLSIGGIDGTLRHRFRNWGDVHAVRAKSGTLDAVTALSGYVAGPPGRGIVAFSILVNGISGKVSLARGSMDKVVDATARQLWLGVSPAERRRGQKGHQSKTDMNVIHSREIRQTWVAGSNFGADSGLGRRRAINPSHRFSSRETHVPERQSRFRRGCPGHWAC
jgi:D-alanyl-D-alanine carboxypeptidase/D-alanyl-D-alanine-endopeptidase (penicillin-binding protein 4)